MHNLDQLSYFLYTARIIEKEFNAKYIIIYRRLRKIPIARNYISGARARHYKLAKLVYDVTLSIRSDKAHNTAPLVHTPIHITHTYVYPGRKAIDLQRKIRHPWPNSLSYKLSRAGRDNTYISCCGFLGQ